jgi:hypothetical protein
MEVHMKELHGKIRELASRHFVVPARSTGTGDFCIAIRDLMKQAEREGISAVQRAPAFCRSIQTLEFLRQNRLRIVRVDGPPSKLSTTVVIHYRREDEVVGPAAAQLSDQETPSERAYRLTEKLRKLGKPEVELGADPLLEISGILRGAIREGAAAFLKELRKDKGLQSERNDTEHAA